MKSLLTTPIDIVTDWHMEIEPNECIYWFNATNPLVVYLTPFYEIASMLGQWGLNGRATSIAQACGGNVRAALLDAQSVLDVAAA